MAEEEISKVIAYLDYAVKQGWKFNITIIPARERGDLEHEILYAVSVTPPKQLNNDLPKVATSRDGIAQISYPQAIREAWLRIEAIYADLTNELNHINQHIENSNPIITMNKN